MGAAYRNIYEAGGFFEYGGETPDIYYFELMEDGVAPLFGFEYSYKIKRHVLSLGMRFSTGSLVEYSYHNSFENWDEDFRLDAATAEFLVGYGYNFGGAGDKVQTEESRLKWLFPVHFGFLLMPDDNNSNSVSPVAAGGILYKFKENVYLGITGFGFKDGGAPLLTAAWGKDPDRMINSAGFIVIPMMDTIIASGIYSIAINRFSISAIFGGDLTTIGNIAYGLMAGYFF